ncbi:DedA family protein [Pseudooceanicola sp.]|uniref:DedA family protein n=1 Tax=Pseudooceanicola sp. TaxID=1914328 RepID=UPI0026075135|nr:DedA family protein [Pseudooceanicola sp.]MDF1854109.1 DedA family protein [Pseudooceanicola sp.]
MTDTLFALIADWGVPLLAVITFLSCLALPVPSSLAMLTAGAFTASGDMTLAATAGGALAGAVIGDQAGYLIARAGSARLERLLARRPKRRALFERARALTDKHGGPGVFFSRWLVSPLGPYANFAAGLTRFHHLKFTLWGAAGEVAWVAIYIGLGRLFAGQLDMAAEFAQDLSGLAAALALMGLSAFWMTRTLRRRSNGRTGPHGKG